MSPQETPTPSSARKGKNDANTPTKDNNNAKNNNNNNNGTKNQPKKKKQNNNKNNKNSNKKIPQKGDPDYLTPTQLRNRRKRRAKQQEGDTPNDGQPPTNNTTTTNGKKSNSNNNSNAMNKKDPSMKYIKHPIKAPIVQSAKKYFASSPTFQDSKLNFHVHLGPLFGWRTVSKLAVRPNGAKNKKVAIGLFLPQSHTLLPVPNCRAHHEGINVAVECVTMACHEVGIVPYEEAGAVGDGKGAKSLDDAIVAAKEGDVSHVEKGMGQLRYVAINIERNTGASQMTLVWNGPPPAGDDKSSGSKRKYGGGIEDPKLEELVAKILAMSNSADNDNSNSNNNNNNNSSNASDGKMKDGDNEAKEVTHEKKRRRRGRREGNAATEDEVYNKPNLERPRSISDMHANTNKSETHHNTLSKSTHPKLNLHSLWINYNPSWKHSNAIFAYDTPTNNCWRHIHGPPAVIEHLTFGGDGSGSGDDDKMKTKCATANPPQPSYKIPLHFPPNVFRQANIDAFTHIVGRIRERVIGLATLLQSHEDQSNNNGGGKKFSKTNHNLPSCVELYGGVGTIGLHLSDTVSSLVSSDENPNNAKCFNDSVHTFPGTDIQSRLSYKQKNAADMIKTEHALLQKTQVLVVDPPRKGLDVEVVDYLCKEGWKTMKLVVYVSCGFQAFQRDCDALVKSGRWKVEFAEGYLLFPGSDAIETLAFFVPV